MNWRELVWSHKYAEAIADLRRHLASNPTDMAAVGWMADTLRAAGEYAEALSLFEQLDAHERQDKVANILAPGGPGRQIDIACLHWLLDDRAKAVQLMHGLAAGILDGSIKYGDTAGGMSQGLLLYYMAVSETQPKEMSFALDYLRNRVEQADRQNWPCVVALYYLGDVAFADVMERVDRRISTMPLAPATLDLGRRKRLCVALFHDGIKSRAQGNEARCLVRMRECFALENPVIEQEWYLARYEVEKADSAPVRR
jgi:tetratricopeptide (TPR) repeat protein